ncbi:MAG: hypothetical protein IKQ15_10400 [Kiritimatiellae bacterium]|nr:hypothetical protein [Kiritimatiellia bacterium]
MKKRPAKQPAKAAAPAPKAPPRPAAPIYMNALPQREREALRLRLFALWEKGVPAEKASADLHIRIITVRKNYARFEQEGASGAYEKPHGFALISKSEPDREAEDALVAAIAAGAPGDSAPGHAVWSASTVIDFYRTRFGKTLSRTAAVNLLRRLGFLNGSPVPSDRIKLFRDWEKENLPEIRALARNLHALVAWVDETLATPMSSSAIRHNRDATLPADLAPRYKTLSAMFLTGELFFRRLDGDLTPGFLGEFLEGLRAEQGNRPFVFLMEDRRRLWNDEMTAWRKEQRDAGKLWIRCYPRLHRPSLIKTPRPPRASLEDILDALH